MRRTEASIAGFEARGQGPRAQEGWWLVELEKFKETEPSQSLRKWTSSAETLDFSPVRPTKTLDHKTVS